MFSKLFNRKKETVNKASGKVTNAGVANPYGMGSSCDMSMDARALYDQPFTFNEQINESERMYYSDWQSKKIINIVVDDMLRHPWTYEGVEDDQVDAISRYLDKLSFSKSLREALRLERLHGGSAIFMGVSDGLDDPSVPLDYRSLSLGSLRFLNTIERRRINKVEYDYNAISPTYGRPEFYFIDAHKIHRSRLLLFDGDPILPVPTQSTAAIINYKNDGFGFPILMTLYNDLLFATGSRRAAYHLLNRASTLVFSGDLQTLAETVQGNTNLGQLQELLNNINNYNAALLNNHPGQEASVDTLAANFGAVPELIMTYLQVLSAASDIPATRFLGQAPGGLNATGAADLENYYNMIGSRQRNNLEPVLFALLRVVCASVFGDHRVADKIQIEFPPLWNISEVEQAQVRQIDTANIAMLSSQGIITDEEALEEAKARGVFVTVPEEVGVKDDSSDLETTDPKESLKGLMN